MTVDDVDLPVIAMPETVFTDTMRKPEYMVIVRDGDASASAELESAVQMSFTVGWRPVGGVALSVLIDPRSHITRYHCAQAMIRNG
jgi:hypothetical protein